MSPPHDTALVEIRINLVHWVIGLHVNFDQADDAMLLIGIGPLCIAIAKPWRW